MIPSGADGEVESLRPATLAPRGRARRISGAGCLLRQARTGGPSAAAPVAVRGAAGGCAVVFWPDIAGGQVYFGSDTLAFYYPLTTWYASSSEAVTSRSGFPYIFGGYPCSPTARSGCSIR